VLGVGAGLLGDRAGQLGLVPGGLLRGERGLPFPLHTDALGDVGLHADEAHQGPGAVEDGADRQLVPERGAVLAVVQQGRGDRALLREGGPDLRDGRRIGRRTLQEPAVPADRLVRLVAGDPRERRVDPDQRVIRLPWVGDGEGDVGGDDGPLAQRLQIGVGVVGLRDRVELEEDDEGQ
jgi:hypothetical protein